MVQRPKKKGCFIYLVKRTKKEIPNTVAFYAELNRDKLLTKYIWFCRVKYRGVVNNFDTNGGFITFSEIKKLHLELNTSKSNIQKLFKAFNELSWLEQTHTGYKLIGCIKIAQIYVPEIKKITFLSFNKSDILIQSANSLLRTSITQQAYKHTRKSKAWLKKHSRILAENQEYTMSVRTLARKMGFKSPMSGVNIEKKLEKAGLFKIERSVQELCPIQEYNIRVKAGQELEKRCFIKNGIVYQRMTNNLIPIKRQRSEVENRVIDFMRVEKVKHDLRNANKNN